MLFQASYKMYLCIQHVRYTKLNIFLSNSIGSGSMDEPRSYDTVAYQTSNNSDMIALSNPAEGAPNKIWVHTSSSRLKPIISESVCHALASEPKPGLSQ